MYIYDDMCVMGKNVIKMYKSMKFIEFSLYRRIWWKCKSFFIYENLFIIVFDDFKGIEIV